jgi:putative two-component system response regulator
MNVSESSPPSPGDLGSLGEQVTSMRTLFGSPRFSVGSVFHGSSAEEVLANPRIAIVDDQPLNVKVVKKYLTLAGYRQFFTTTDSTQALDLVFQEHPDVVLLDIMMPQVSGLEILEKLRQNEEFADLPVIILTAANDKETKITALRLGATEFLGKPVDSVELEARLKNVLSAKAHQDRVKNYAWEMELEVAARTAELADAYREVVGCLAKVGEYRDNETGNHVVRVGRYSQIIARRLGLSDEMVERIAQAAPLHDIGKVGIPDAILLKPGKLENVEFQQMRGHCDYGKSICAPFSDQPGNSFRSHATAGAEITRCSTTPVLRMAATIAATHHERWDGTGYPRGLAGEEIPIEGRITSVADVFDALTSKRPYKPAFSVEKSLEIMREGSGTQFDAAILDAFLGAMEEILEVQREFSDHEDHP